MPRASLDAAAAVWLLAATADELRAYAHFKDDGCKSCFANLSPGCACWLEKLKVYLILEAKPS